MKNILVNYMLFVCLYVYKTSQKSGRGFKEGIDDDDNENDDDEEDDDVVDDDDEYYLSKLLQQNVLVKEINQLLK